MSSGPQPQLNVNKLPAVVPFVPVFGVATDAGGNTYANLGSSYTMSSDGAQVLVDYKIRITANGVGGAIANTVSLPIPASATLGNRAVFPPTPLVVTADGSSTINVVNKTTAPLGNSQTVLGLSAAGPTAANGIYTLNVQCKYMVVAANN